MSGADPVQAAGVRVEGEFTIYRAAELCEVFKTALGAVAEAGELDVDLCEVSEMDSAGLQLLLATKKSARAANRELRLTGASAAVTEVLRTLRLEAHFADLASGAALN